MSLEDFYKEIYRSINAEENNRLIRAEDLKERILKRSYKSFGLNIQRIDI